MAGSGTANDPLIVYSWAEFIAAFQGRTEYIKFADDAPVKVIDTVNISNVFNGYSLQVNFNGWTINNFNVYQVQGYYLFNNSNNFGLVTAANLTINHLNVFKTAKANIGIFANVINCYFYDIYYESHDTTYTDENYGYDFGTGASAQICTFAYNSKLRMRSEDYAPRVPTLRGQNCEIKIDYKWTKTGAGDFTLLMGKRNTRTSSPYEVGSYYNCYIYGKIDLSEGEGTWQWSSPQTTMTGYIDTQKCIFNIETILGQNCTIARVCIDSPTNGNTWETLPYKTLFVTNNGNAAARYQAVLTQTAAVYIDGVIANVVRTLEENLKNKDWLNDICFGFIDDDLFRYPQYATPDFQTKWTWRKSNYVNHSVPFLPFWDYPVIEPPPYYGDVYESPYITIYDMKTKQNEFDGHGLAVLRPTSCRIVEELNGAYSLTLTHPKDPDGKHEYILEMNIIQALGQLFVIQRVDEVMTGNSYSVTAYAEHISYTLNDRWIFPPVTIAGYHGTTLMESIIQQSTDMGGDWQTNYTFAVGSDIDAPSDFQDWYDMKDGVTPYEMLVGSHGFVAKLGGELYRDNFVIRVDKRMRNAQDNAFELAIGYNLTGIKRTVDLTTFCTYFRAYDVSDGYYETWWAISYDPASLPRAYPRNVVRSANFVYDHEEYKEGQLERDGYAFWGQNCAPLVTYELSVKDLKRSPDYKEFDNNYRFKVGDRGKIWDERLQAWNEVEITRTEKDGITGETVKVVIGSQRSFTRPNSYNPISPTQIDADKVIEGYPPINFMSDGGNLRHMVIYGDENGVGDTVYYDTDLPSEVKYDVTTGQRTTGENYWSTDLIQLSAGFMYYITPHTDETHQIRPGGAVEAGIYSLYYAANGDYINYDVSTGETCSFVAPAGTKFVRLMAHPVDETAPIKDFLLSGLGIIVRLVSPDPLAAEKITVIPIATPLMANETLDVSTTGVNIPTFSGENTLYVDTTVIPKVRIQYKEPIQHDINRTLEGTLPLTFNSNGDDLTNWIIWGNTGGVGTVSSNLFDSTLSNDHYSTNGIKDGTDDNYISSDILIPCEPNTEYSFSIHTTSENNCSNVPVTIYEYRANGNMVMRSIKRITTVSADDTINTKVTWTTGAYTVSLRFMLTITNFKTDLNLSTVPDFMFYTGSTKKPYEPAGGIPVVISNGTSTKRVNIPVTAPVGKGNTISKQTSGISIPTFSGENTITVTSAVTPEKMKIQYKEPL